MHIKQQGFSLVELSIVLVILGLLTGGILTGQNLIRAAELRAVTTELAAYQTAVLTFRDKYMALPGDMKNATLFWGAATCPGAVATPSLTKATCNGNGDGMIFHGVSTADENYRFWQHLANAGLIEGSYSGVTENAAAGVWDSKTGWNAPKSRVGGAGWDAIYFLTNISGAVTWRPPVTAGHMFSLGIADASLHSGVVFTPEEMWSIDTKIDDGNPFVGKIMSWPNGNCQNGTTITATYKLNATSVGCTLWAQNPF